MLRKVTLAVMVVSLITILALGCIPQKPKISKVDGGSPYLTPDSLVISGEGIVHIAYEESGALFLESLAPDGTATKEQVAPRYAHDYALAVGPDGVIHLAWWNNDGDLFHAVKVAGGWIKEMVVQQGNGWGTNMAIGPDNSIHLVYQCSVVWAGTLIYLHSSDDGEWVSETVEEGGYYPHVSLAVDGESVPHLAYFDYLLAALKLAVKGEVGFTIETLEVEIDGSAISLAVDQDGSHHLAYYGYHYVPEPFGNYYTDLIYATDAGGEWSNQVFSRYSEILTGRVAIDIDVNGQPHFVRADWHAGWWYAYQTSGEWVFESIDWVAGQVAIATADDGVTHTIVGNGWDPSQPIVHAAADRQAGEWWQLTTVATAKPIGSHTSIGIEQNGMVHVGYYDAYEGDLWHATRVGNSWIHEQVDPGTGENIGYIHDLVIDDQNQPNFIFPTANYLYHMVKESGEWEATVMDEFSGGYTTWVDATKGDDGFLHVCQTAYHGGVFYYTNSSGGWTKESVHAINKSMGQCFIDLGPMGQPQILYREPYSELLHLAVKEATGWLVEPLDILGCEAYDFSLAVDSQGGRHLAYVDYDPTARGFKYATDAGGEWKIQTIEEGPDRGLSPDIAIDSDDRVHLVYYNSVGSGLRYATNESGIFSVAIIDDEGYVGQNPSIILDQEEVQVAYVGLNTAWYAKFPEGYTGR